MFRGLMIMRWLAPADDLPQGSQTPSGQGKVDEPKYVTEEQLNRAISARFGDFSKKIEKSLETAIGGFGAKLDELKSSFTPSSGEPSKETPKGAELADSPLVKGLQRQLEEQKKATERIQQDRDAEKARARDQRLRSTLADDLTKGGIDPRYVKQAVGIFVDVEKRVRFTDDDGDEVVFKDATGDVDLSTGLKGWLKSDDAKIYLPPRGSQGSGDRSQGRPAQHGQPAPTVGATLLAMAKGASGDGPAQG